MIARLIDIEEVGVQSNNINCVNNKCHYVAKTRGRLLKLGDQLVMKGS